MERIREYLQFIALMIPTVFLVSLAAATMATKAIAAIS